jgi:hypothetical protein
VGIADNKLFIMTPDETTARLGDLLKRAQRRRKLKPTESNLVLLVSRDSSQSISDPSNPTHATAGAAITSRKRCDDVHKVQIADGRRYGLE